MKKRFLLVLCMTGLLMLQVGCTLESKRDDGPTEELITVDEDEVSEEADITEEDEEDVVIEVVEDAIHSSEYKAAYENGDVIGINFIASYDDEVSQFDTWRDGYESLIDDASDDTVFALIYVDDDDIPELYYKNMLNGQVNVCVATFFDGYVNILSGGIEDFNYNEKENSVRALFDDGYMEAIAAIKDGKWINIGYGSRQPLDLWAEDGFDENGNPIINSWTWNDEELGSQDKYDETLALYFNLDKSKSVDETYSKNDIMTQIQEME